MIKQFFQKFFNFLIFFSKVSGPCKYLHTVVTFKIASETFKITGKTLLEPGYTAIMPWEAFGKNETLPNFTVDATVTINDVRH